MGGRGAVVVRVGLVTPVGMGAAQTAASVLADIDGFQESPVMGMSGEPFVMALLPQDALPPLADALEAADGITARQRRMLRLATPALEEALAELPAEVRPGSIPLLLATPEKHADLAEPVSDAFLEQLSTQSGAVFDLAGSRLFPAGRAGGYQAVAEAVRRLRKEEAELVLVGGVDSYLDLMLLAALEREKRLLGGQVTDGFLPGEGAGFLLLGREGAPVVGGLEPIARLAAVRMGEEPGHRGSEEPYRGDGLAAAFAKLFATPGALREPARTAYLGLNGESFPAKEWGVASLRSSAELSPELDVRHPADCFGDIGAAFGPVMIGLAALGVQAATCAPPCVVWSSSEGSARGAALVDVVAG